MRRCRITKQGIKPCKGLSGVIQDAYGRGTRQRGVSLHTLVNMETNKFSRQIVVLKSGEHSKKGIVFNNCPFCAGELYQHSKARKAKSP